MSLAAGKIPKMPDLACLGVVKEVGDVYLSEKGVYYVIPVQIEGKYGGRDATFFFLFQPKWFERNFDPATLLKEDRKGKLYGAYRRFVNDESRVSALVALAGKEFSALVEAFDGLEKVDEKAVEEVLKQILPGQDVGYILTQRFDMAEGKRTPTEMYNIGRWFALDEAGLKAISVDANNPKRRKPLVMTWEDGNK